MELSEEKKYALVTGGSRGIGRAICVKLAEMGYYILINFHSNEAAANETHSLVQKAGSDGEILKFNVADRAEVRNVLGSWKETSGAKCVEVIVNNAGITKDGLFVIMSDEDWDGVLDTSLGGFFNVSRFLMHDMLRNRYGRVINVVSLSGQKGQAGQANYSAAKAALIGVTKALGQEVAKRNVTVNAVAPGFIRSDMTAGLPEQELKDMIPMKRFGEPEEVAAAVGFLASREASYITGNVVSINGGLYT